MSRHWIHERLIVNTHTNSVAGNVYLVTDLLEDPGVDSIVGCDEVFLGCDLSRYHETTYTASPWKEILEEKTVVTPLVSNIEELNRALNNRSDVRLAHLPLHQLDVPNKAGSLELAKIYKSIDSRERFFDGSKLMPFPEVPKARLQLENHHLWQSVTSDSQTKSLRYRLGVTKRHLLALLFSLKGNSKSISREEGANSIDSTSTGPVEILGVEQPAKIPLAGITYCFITDNLDEESGWNEMVSAFCAAFKDYEDVNLVVYLRNDRRECCAADFNHVLHTLGPLQCNVFLLQGSVTEEEYSQLIAETTYFVGTCRRYTVQSDLIAFACAGKPIISLPNCMDATVNEYLITLPIGHTMELSYPDKSNCIKYTTRAFRMNWESLYRQFIKSYQLANSEDAYVNLCQQHQLNLNHLFFYRNEAAGTAAVNTLCTQAQQAINP